MRPDPDPPIHQALFGQRWPFYLRDPVVPLSWWLVYRTRWGLEVRAAGENPGIDLYQRDFARMNGVRVEDLVAGS